jgi:hypothetical protein
MAAWLHAAILIASGHPKAMMDFAHAKIAAISEVRSLSGKISVFSWVSQNIFPGPHPLAVVRRRKQDVFPEGHFQGHVAATGWDSPPAPPLHACCLLNFNSHGSQQGLSTVSRPLYLILNPLSRSIVCSQKPQQENSCRHIWLGNDPAQACKLQGLA